jgi:uncharacterized membrane protein YgdD (TMEM256/DUF423 family)
VAKFIVIAGSLGFVGVALGAFGAHGLEEKLISTGHLDTWKTAKDYLFVHVLALFVLAATVTEGNSRPRAWTAWFWVAGIVIFSGSLYTLALTGVSKLGMVTPFGGLCFMVGWACLVLLGFKKSNQSVENP